MILLALNPLSIEQIEADLFLANAAIQKAESLSSRKGKYYRGQAGYHLQQAAEKLIKLQIYDSDAEINNAKMYRHSLDDLITYAASLGVAVIREFNMTKMNIFPDSMLTNAQKAITLFVKKEEKIYSRSMWIDDELMEKIELVVDYLASDERIEGMYFHYFR